MTFSPVPLMMAFVAIFFYLVWQLRKINKRVDDLQKEVKYETLNQEDVSHMINQQIQKNGNSKAQKQEVSAVVEPDETGTLDMSPEPVEEAKDEQVEEVEPEPEPVHEAELEDAEAKLAEPEPVNDMEAIDEDPAQDEKSKKRKSSKKK